MPRPSKNSPSFAKVPYTVSHTLYFWSQLLPATANEYGVSDLTDPADNLYAGTMHLLWLQDYFKDYIQDPDQKTKFVLAAYNVGHGHVMDAIRLTDKFGGDSQNWSEVSDFLLKKSNSKYYNDEVVQFGYCRGIEPVTYVSTIYGIYESYVALFPDDLSAN